jgi:hypothetical protein
MRFAEILEELLKVADWGVAFVIFSVSKNLKLKMKGK